MGFRPFPPTACPTPTPAERRASALRREEDTADEIPLSLWTPFRTTKSLRSGNLPDEEDPPAGFPIRPGEWRSAASSAFQVMSHSV